MKKKQKVKSGFTIMELLLVMFFLSVAFASLFGLFAAGITSAKESQKTLVAAELAQEGVEIVENIRDSNALKLPHLEGENIVPQDVFFGLGAGICFVDYASEDCDFSGSKNASRELFIDPYGRYVLTKSAGNNSSGFVRWILLGPDVDGAKKVDSFVLWDSQVVGTSKLLSLWTEKKCRESKECAYASGVITRWHQ